MLETLDYGPDAVETGGEADGLGLLQTCVTVMMSIKSERVEASRRCTLKRRDRWWFVGYFVPWDARIPVPIGPVSN